MISWKKYCLWHQLWIPTHIKKETEVSLKLVFRENSSLPCWVRVLTDGYFIYEMCNFFWIFTKITSDFSETLTMNDLPMITVLQPEWSNTRMNRRFLPLSSLLTYKKGFTDLKIILYQSYWQFSRNRKDMAVSNKSPAALNTIPLEWLNWSGNTINVWNSLVSEGKRKISLGKTFPSVKFLAPRTFGCK